MLVHARLVGLAFLGAGALVRFGGRILGRYAFLLGGLAAIYIASREWQSSPSWLTAGGILVVGLLVSAAVAWIVRAISFVVALALCVVAWYLLLYGWIGADFVTTVFGSITWVTAVILSMMGVGWLSRWNVRRLGLAAKVASVAMAGPRLS